MWTLLQPLNLIRYLCLWRVNRALVRLPKYLPLELSQVLGTIIAERLPTREARPWQKALNVQTPCDLTWPVETVLFPYPGKSTYGPGEPILWELKLLGAAADHGFFLEVILPAMEAAGATTDPRWYQPNSLWGRFDVEAVYAARGPQWEPLVSQGRLDLRYQASPLQWAEGLSWDFETGRAWRRLTWLTPFDLNGLAGAEKAAELPGDPIQPSPEAPALQLLLEALLARMARLLPGKYTTPGDVWNSLEAAEQAALWDAIAQAGQARLHRQELEPVPAGWPGRWRGQQTFARIPSPLLPYLELASILHLGRQTHLGCGTFVLS